MSDRTVALSPLAAALQRKDIKAVLRALQTMNLEGPVNNRTSNGPATRRSHEFTDRSRGKA